VRLEVVSAFGQLRF